MGIMIISYTIKEVNDDVDYLKSLGMARTAEVQRDARIGEAQARMQVGSCLITIILQIWIQICFFLYYYFSFC